MTDPTVPTAKGIRFQKLASLAAFVSFVVGLSAQGDTIADETVNRRLLAEQQPVYGRAFDSHPAWISDDGGGLVFWHSFIPGAERLLARPLEGRPNPQFLDVSGGTGTFTPAEAASSKNRIAVAWSKWDGTHWVLQGRLRDNGDWKPVVDLSSPHVDAIHGHPANLGDDAIAIAWSEWKGGRFELYWARWTPSGLEATARFSDPGTDAFRPQLATDGSGALFAVWDAYASGTSVVFARQLLPSLGPIERISESSDRCLKPSVTVSADGSLTVAWIRATDVMARNAVDQVHVIQVAQRVGNGRWETFKNEAGGDEAAWLTSGLLAKMEPKPVATGGYMGRRRDPMFVHDGADLWLIWERKEPHTGTTSVVTGELLGRKVTKGRLGPVVSLMAGMVDYRFAHHARARDGKVEVLASSLPRDGQRNYRFATLRFADAKPARTEPWPGWSRVDMPLDEAAPRRRTISDGTREYHLFWMDSHVHSTLSADAEGEPDEILFYARDRGMLDTVVMQENDFFNCPLTDYEYELGNFFSKALSQDGRFVAMPGYEWTQRLPIDKGIPVNDPRLWSGSYPNHRTVIYPRAGGPLIRYTDVGNDINRLYAVVARHGGIMHTQHPEFDFNGAPGEVAIEVTAGWGIYFLNPGRIHATLREGHRAGFVGTSDSHRRNPGLGGGLTGIYATGLTPDAILEAYRSRRVFATTGARIAIEARANGALMGREVTTGSSVTLTLAVDAGRPIRRATLVRDGTDLKVFTSPAGGMTQQFEHVDSVTTAGTHWYYWRIEIEGESTHFGGNVTTAFGNLGWSTPNWVAFNP